MNDQQNSTRPVSRLYIPAAGAVYEALMPFTETLIRLVAGLSLIPHGWPKLMNPAGTAAFLAKEGFEPAMFWAVALGLTETLGGLLLAIGLFTRVACMPVLVFLTTAVVHHSQYGFAWNETGFEYPLFWAIVVFHFLINGAGPYSVDARIGREF
jgi:putative oxidoreductase